LEGRGGPNGGVYLDISHRPKEEILEKLPRMYRQFIEHQLLDISREPMEVSPTAHYSMGGIVVDPETHATDVEGLFAAGEVTSGLHGANRLGGNSLTETLVFGRHAGAAAAAHSRARESQLRSRGALAAAVDDLKSMIHTGSEIVRPVQRALRTAMWEHCGVVRSESGIEEGLKKVDELEALLPSIDIRPTSEGFGDLAHILDLRASLIAARATLYGARERRETRGAHNRSDYPDIDTALQVNFQVTMDDDGTLNVASEPVPSVPEHLQDYAGDAHAYEAAGRLLE
jgi:succinate dehydrogenase / fumarate reductase flavoprotein subunit